MRTPTLSLIFLIALVSPAAAQPAQSAQVAFVERRGLLEADQSCHLLDANVRAALRAGAGQARGQLLSGGWTVAQLDELETATIRAARTRACDDARTLAAVAQAQDAYAGWARLHAITFPGWERSWSARRTPDPQGWVLRQEAPAPNAATFGVREIDGVHRLTLFFSMPASAMTPPSAEMRLRNPARQTTSFVNVPGRTATGLEAGAPIAAASRRFIASSRWNATPANGRRDVTFAFPDAAFEAMMALEPREAIEITWTEGASTRRVLIEVGDIAAARAFLAIRD